MHRHPPIRSPLPEQQRAPGRPPTACVAGKAVSLRNTFGSVPCTVVWSPDSVLEAFGRQSDGRSSSSSSSPAPWAGKQQQQHHHHHWPAPATTASLFTWPVTCSVHDYTQSRVWPAPRCEVDKQPAVSLAVKGEVDSVNPGVRRSGSTPGGAHFRQFLEVSQFCNRTTPGFSFATIQPPVARGRLAHSLGNDDGEVLVFASGGRPAPFTGTGRPTA